MNRDDVIRMAREAELCDADGRDSDSIVIASHLERFANLVAASERERCIHILKTTYIIDDGEDYAQLVLDRINEDS